jgi:hypothetical protein
MRQPRRPLGVSRALWCVGVVWLISGVIIFTLA